MLQIKEITKGYEVSFNFNRNIVADIKAIEGSRWLPHLNLWHVPSSQGQAIDLLILKYGIYTPDESPQVVGDIPDLPNLENPIDLKRKLFKYQEKGVAFGLNKKRFINGDEPGLGKTSQAIATIVGANSYPCLAICPSTLKLNWQKEWDIVAGVPAMILSEKTIHIWQEYARVGLAKVFIVNYESLKKYFVNSISTPKGEKLKLNHIKFNTSINIFKSVIIDELHRCKDAKAQQTKYVIGIAKNKEYVIGLTGTPVVNGPKDLISQLEIIDHLKNLGGYQYYINRYCGLNSKSGINLEELHYKLKNTCFFQRKKEEVLPDLPPKTRQIIECDITNRKEYNDAIADLATYLKEYREKSQSEINKSLKGEIMVRIGVCRNISARGKLNEVFEVIDQEIEANKKVVVFVHQRDVATSLLDRYPHAVSVTGKDSAETRNKSVHSFQNDDHVKIIICSIKAAGVGLTLTASSRVLMVEMPWHAADCNQCEDRTHRIGQLSNVLVTYFLGHKTIDQYIYELVESKRSVANAITGNDEDIETEIINKITTSLFDVDNTVNTL